MSQTITITQSVYKELTANIARLDKKVTQIMNILNKEPRYGTKAWWKWAHRKGMEDKENGEYYELKSKKDIDDFFNHLDDEEYVYSKFHHKGKKTSE